MILKKKRIQELDQKQLKELLYLEEYWIRVLKEGQELEEDVRFFTSGGQNFEKWQGRSNHFGGGQRRDLTARRRRRKDRSGDAREKGKKKDREKREKNKDNMKIQ